MQDCDGCSFCCTILGVVELKKPAGDPCKFCTGNGCAVHADVGIFPPTCRDFDCGFRISKLGPEFRPDRCKIMITGEDASLNTHILHVDPDHPYAPHTIVGLELIQIVLKAGQYPNILLVTGDKERIISRDRESARRLAVKLKRLKELAQNETW